MNCSLCEDTGWRPVVVDGVRRVERCECWRSSLIDRLVREASIPDRYRHCDLDSFRDNNDSLTKAVRTCRRFLDEWAAERKGLFFIGKPGLGKTHLAVAVLKEFIQRTHLRGRFCDVRELLKQIRYTYNPVVQSTELDVIRPVMECDLLVLDDIGAERVTEWVAETLNLIVSTRYNQRRMTLFTSNYDIKEDLADPESLPVRLGYRMWSRVHEMCDFVHLTGIDYREAGPEPSIEELSRLDKRGSLSHRLDPRRKGMIKAQLKPTRELGWTGGKGGS